MKRGLIGIILVITSVLLLNGCLTQKETNTDFDYTRIKEGYDILVENLEKRKQSIEKYGVPNVCSHISTIGYKSADGQSHYQRCAKCKEILSESEPCAFDERDFDYLLKYNDYRLLSRKCPNCGAMEVLVTTKSFTQLAAMGIRVETR